jgi:hypothetical protein
MRCPYNHDSKELINIYEKDSISWSDEAYDFSKRVGIHLGAGSFDVSGLKESRMKSMELHRDFWKDGEYIHCNACINEFMECVAKFEKDKLKIKVEKRLHKAYTKYLLKSNDTNRPPSALYMFYGLEKTDFSLIMVLRLILTTILIIGLYFSLAIDGSVDIYVIAIALMLIRSHIIKDVKLFFRFVCYYSHVMMYRSSNTFSYANHFNSILNESCIAKMLKFKECVDFIN